ncbi:MAG: preprotein translocase subunit SecY [Candidatus Pacearchaeota archaeon]
MGLKSILLNLPEIKKPDRRLSFNEKLKWVLIVLGAFFVLSTIPLYGLSENALSRFEFLAIILGAKFGSIMSLGIGPIVTASIILQLLVGSKLLNIDLKTHEGRAFFQGLQKALAIFFTLFEACVYVLMKGLEAKPGLEWLLILQLFIGGLLIIFMDEIVTKWGFGSGVSLFIVGGVAYELFIRAFTFIGPQGRLQPIGKVWLLFSSFASGNTTEATSALVAIAATAIIFIFVVYVQSIRAEIPLSFGRIKGFGLRWPLAFLYTSNIPVILAAALLANIQLFATLAQKYFGHATFLGGFNANGQAVSGLAFWISSPPIVEAIIRGAFQPIMLAQALTYIFFLVAASIIFSVFWVQTSGMDARSVAEQITASGLSIPGFRTDPRIIEIILSRYIMPLAVMGGAAVGLLAGLADLLGALVRGTGLLLAVMIIYRLYQEISQQHMYDMNPALRKFIGGA